MNPIRFTYDDRKHRRFTIGARTFRAFWSTGYRRWTIIETDPTSGVNLIGSDGRNISWQFRNWPELDRQFLTAGREGARDEQR